jgi:sterol desaturase/sphingolipid hydroxylase (fatty acid hydroxylase superfamily)
MPLRHIEQVRRVLEPTYLAAGKNVMQLSKRDYYAEIFVYPPLVLVLAVAAWCGPHSSFHPREPAEIFMGVVIWTLIEYLIHRAVLHSVPLVKRMHDMHHVSPTAFVGTPTWVSLTGFAVGALLPLWWLTGLEAAGSVTAGLMLGYFWYLVVHDAVHRWPLDRKSIHYAAKLRHMRHHFGGGEGNFGVTVAVWDRLLGTFIEPSTPNRRPWSGSQLQSSRTR